MSTLKTKILKLRDEGKTYNEISNELGCSKGTISYHCGVGQKEKTAKRRYNFRKNSHPYLEKTYRFQEKYTLKNKRSNKKHWRKIMTDKIYDFHKTKQGTSMIIDGETSFTVEDVINKFGEHPICYLTGDLINIYETSSFNFDHIIPRSRGGENTLDNLGICTKEANFAKGDMTPKEFLEFCKKVVEKLS